MRHLKVIQETCTAGGCEGYFSAPRRCPARVLPL